MLPATKLLLALYYRDNNHIQKRELKNAYIRAIIRHGSMEDVKALLPVFLEVPQQCEELIQLLMSHGDILTAQALVENCFQGEQLRDRVPEGVLHCLGYLGYTPAQQILFEYVKSGDYYLSQAACMGLLHLPCEGLEREIEAQIKQCYGQSLFPEFIPALAIKTKNDFLLEEIFHLGQTTASTDCNGGIILGVALYGKKGFDLFKKIIWSPNWEAFCGATGSRFYLYIGMQYLGISLLDIYLELKKRQKQQEHGLYVIEALLKLRIIRPPMALRFVSEVDESYSQIYTALFTWSEPNHEDNLIGLAKNIFGDSDRIVSGLYEIERQLLLRMEQEIETEVLGKLVSMFLDETSNASRLPASN